MERLRSGEIKSALDFLRDVYSLRDYEAFGRYLVTALPQLIRSEKVYFHPASLLTGRKNIQQYVRTQMFMEPASHVTPDWWEFFFKRAFAEHPLVRFFNQTTDKQALRITDLVTKQQWKKLHYYNEGFCPHGDFDQLAVSLASARQRSICGTLALSRDSAFSERDKAMLNLLRPHLRQAFLNSVAVSTMRRELSSVEHAMELMDRGVVVLKETGQIGLITPQAHEWLVEYFGVLRVRHLPDELERWVRSQKKLSLGESAVAQAREPLRVEREGKRLVVRMVSDGSGDMLLMEEKRLGATVEEVRERFGLTQREAEVMYWVAEGKSNIAVGTILSMRPKTVEKHLERIYLKMGVENRTEAAMSVRDMNSILS